MRPRAIVIAIVTVAAVYMRRETVNDSERPPGGCQRAGATRAVGGDGAGAGYRAAMPLTAMFRVCVGALRLSFTFLV